MSRITRTLVFALVGTVGLVLGTANAHAQPFIPKKPEDLIPKKPEDLIPKLPQNETQFSGQTKMYFNYTIKNDSGTTVRFRLPSGKDYTLNPGAKGSYYFNGYKPQAVIHVYNSGKTYDLTGGNHQFWWMKNEQRVGLDLNHW